MRRGAAARADRSRTARTGRGTTARRPSAGCDRSVRQNGCVTDAMMPKIVPSGRRKRSAGAELCSTIASGVPKRSATRSRISARETTAAGVQRVAPPTSMYSMNRTSAPIPRPKSTSAGSSSSLTPRRTTVSIFSASNPASAAASRPRRTAPWRSRRVSRRKRSARSVSRLTVSRWRPAARRSPRLIREEHAVGREREVFERGTRREALDERRQPLPHEGLAARDTDAVHAFVREGIDDRADFLVRQQVLPRQPDVFLLRHAVLAAEVAAIGDGNAKAPQRPSERIDYRHHTVII